MRSQRMHITSMHASDMATIRAYLLSNSFRSNDRKYTSWSRKYLGRLAFKTHSRPKRLDTQQKDISMGKFLVGSNQHRSFCFQTKFTMLILQLVSRSSSSSHRRFCSRLEPISTGLPQSPMDLDGQVPGSGDSADSNSSSHCSLVAKSTMVQSTTSDGNRPSESSTSNRESDIARTKQNNPNSTPEILVDCMACLR